MPSWKSTLTDEQQEAALAAMFASVAAQNADPAYQRSKAILQVQRRMKAARDYQTEDEIMVVRAAAYREMVGAA